LRLRIQFEISPGLVSESDPDHFVFSAKVIEIPSSGRMIAMELIFENRAEYLYVKAVGKYSITAACDCLLRTLEVIDHSTLTKVLTDCLQVQGSPSTFDHYTFATLLAKEMTKTARRKTLKVVYVGHVPVLDDQKFGLLVARNHGVDRVFSADNFPDALKWLGVNNDHEPDAVEPQTD
jgi:hypothetical protein